MFEEYLAHEKFLSLPALTGTPKQVAWALDIRKRWMLFNRSESALVVRAWYLRQTSAKFWIENQTSVDPKLFKHESELVADYTAACEREAARQKAEWEAKRIPLLIWSIKNERVGIWPEEYDAFDFYTYFMKRGYTKEELDSVWNALTPKEQSKRGMVRFLEYD